MKRKRLYNALKILILVVLMVVLTAPEWPRFQDERHQINAILGQRHFDFLVWGFGAVSTKVEAALAGGQPYLTPEQRKQLVLDYLDLLDDVRGLESLINRTYSDPEVADPASETMEERSQVAKKRELLALRQPMVEAIIQEQVASVLVDQGLDLLGTSWPPVEMHMTALPYVLIVSPRDEIRQIHNIPLEHGLSIQSRENIESMVLDTTDRSALVVSIGGLGIYPAMIVETANINLLADVVAHEWAHHWLTLHPVGLNYASSPELRTINETIASIVGEEVGRLVIQRFYPEFVPPPPDESGQGASSEGDPDAFDFNAEMRKTRIHVDELLARDRVEEAEQYMEERRQFLWDNGYRLRKINQAFFAFYGAYADTPGEGGDDPIGPTLLALREDSPTLREFLDRVSPITSLGDLEDTAANLSMEPGE